MAKTIARQAYEADIRNEIHEIRAMFAALKRCFDGLEDKSQFKEADLLFAGFDPENEQEHHRTANLIAQFSGQATQDSDSRKLQWYQTLVRRWNESANKEKLTKEDLRRITAPA